MVADVKQIQIFQVNDVDGRTVGDTLIAVTNGNTQYGRFIVDSVRVVLKESTGVGLTEPIISVGYTNPDYNDVVDLASLPATLPNTPHTIALLDGVKSIENNTSIYIRVATAATGYSGYIFNIYVIGFYENVPAVPS